MNLYKPKSEELAERLKIILVEEVNTVNNKSIDVFITKTVNRLLEVVLDEINYGKRIS